MLTSPILAELYELRQEKNNNEESAQNWYKSKQFIFISLHYRIISIIMI